MSLGKSLSVAMAVVTLASVGFACATTPDAVETNVSSKTTLESKSPVSGRLLAKKDKDTFKQQAKEECKIDKNGIEKCEGKSKAWSTDDNANQDTSLNTTTTPSSHSSTYEEKTTVTH